MKDRILKILQEKQLTSAKLADLIAVQRSSISHILSGRNKPSMDFLEKILINFQDISGDWLITGRGDMYKAGYSVSESAQLPEIKAESSYPADLFESTQQRRNNDINARRKDVHSQPPVNNDPVVVQKPVKVVKRVVIYYDDNSYDELFLNK